MPNSRKLAPRFTALSFTIIASLVLAAFAAQESGQGWIDVNRERNIRKAVLAKFAQVTGGTFERNLTYSS